MPQNDNYSISFTDTKLKFTVVEAKKTFLTHTLNTDRYHNTVCDSA